MTDSNPIAQILSQYPVVILDGALATELERRGANLNDPLWSAKVLLEAPDLIRDVHLDYFRAGADCAITASYQATLEGFMRRGLSELKAKELMGRSVQIALEARDAFWQEGQHLGRPKPFVAASVGPYGAYLADGSEYRGHYGLSEDQLVDFHRPRIGILLEAGAEMLACETLPCLLEAKAILRVLQDFPAVPAWFSFSACDGQHISDGTPFSDCVAYLEGFAAVAAIGINCTPPEYIAGLMASAKPLTQKPLLVYPNSGETYHAHTHSWEGAGCEAFAADSRTWHAAGAQIIGGCCRTTPDDIRELARLYRS